jgi:hypothetical protein
LDTLCTVFDRGIIEELSMFQDEAIERQVYDAFDELCSDAGIEGQWADEGPVGLALVPDPLRLGAAVDLWMRIENREETARQGFVERTSILGSHQLETPADRAAASGTDADADAGQAPDDAEYDETPEPVLDEIELRGRMLVDVLNAASQMLSDRRGALELGEELPTVDALRAALTEAISFSFEDGRLASLWNTGALVRAEAD